MENITIIESILRNRRKFFTEIRQDIDVFPKIRAMFLSCLIFLAIYGLADGRGTQSGCCAYLPLKLLFCFWRLY